MTNDVPAGTSGSSLAASGVSAGAAMLFTASWKIILATFLTGLVVDRMLAAMEHWHRCGERRFT